MPQVRRKYSPDATRVGYALFLQFLPAFYLRHSTCIYCVCIYIYSIYIIQSIEEAEGGTEGGVVGDMSQKGNHNIWEDCSHNRSPYKHLMRSRC